MLRIALAAMIVAGSSFAVGHCFAFEANFVLASNADLGNPHDIKLSLDGRHLYVSDVDNDRIAILDSQSLAYLGSFGDDIQDGTHDVDINQDGLLYVADTHNHRVLVYEMHGLRGQKVGELSERVRKPEGALVHPNGRIYVTGAGSDNIVVYEGTRVIAEAGGLSSPHDIEAAPNGDIWIADAANDRLVRMTPELVITTVLNGPALELDGPRYLDILPDGTLIVADKYSHSVKVIAEDGRLIGTLGDGRRGLGPGKFTTPEGVEIRDNTLWISDSGNDRIVRYRFSITVQ